MRKAMRGPTRPDIPPLAWRADSFVLVESLTLPEGVQYRVVRRWPLLPSATGQG